MIPAELAILRLRRDLALSTVVKGLLAAVAVFAVLMEVLFRGPAIAGSLVLLAVGGVWLALSYRSVKGSRIAAASPLLIASGQFQEAERHLAEALHSFSLFRTVKLRTVHQLLVLRHAQRNWRDAAVLGQGLLKQKLGPLAGLSRSTRLILADALLEQNDLHGSYAAITGLYQQHLSLSEALELNLIQLDYLSRIDAWEQMTQNLAQKVQLAELLQPEKSARAQALLALAAKKRGEAEWSQWLKRRVELLCDVRELTVRRPILAELWA